MTRYLIGLFVLLNFAQFNMHSCAARGNVNVELTPEGLLTIYGDREDNTCVLLFRDGEVIVGGANETSINGSNIWFVVPTSSVTNVEIVLGAGADWFRFGCQDIVLADISVDAGAGGDVVWFDGDFRALGTRNPFASVWGNVNINSGRDGDEVDFRGLPILGETSISTGHGSDNILIASYDVRGVDPDSAIGVPCLFGDGLKIDSGLDNDELHFGIDTFAANSGDLLVASVDGDLEIQLGQGDDALNWLSDPCIVTVSGDALLVGGQGDDLGESLDQILVEGSYDVIGFE